MEFQQQGDHQFGGLRPLLLGPAVKRVVWPGFGGHLVPDSGYVIQNRHQCLRIQERRAVVVGPRGKMLTSAPNPAPKQLSIGRHQFAVAHVRQSQLAYPHPSVEHSRVFERVGHQPKAGGVAQAEVAAPLLIETNCQAAALDPSTVLDHVVAQLPEHPSGHELRPVRNPERVVIGIASKRSHPKLTVGVKGGAAKYVASISDPVGIGLASGGQLVDQVAEESDTTVSPGEAQDPRIQTAPFLLGHLDA